jgi:hypothetical protein
MTMEFTRPNFTGISPEFAIDLQFQIHKVWDQKYDKGNSLVISDRLQVHRKSHSTNEK